MSYDGSIRIDTGLDTKGFSDDLSKLGALAATGAAAAVTALGVLSVAAIKVGSDFEAAMSQVAATMGTTTNKIPELTAIAKEMGAATQFSATQAAEALNYLALAGYDSQKSIAALPTVLNLAAAGGMDLAYASDLVTDSMSVLSISTDQLEGFTDQMAKTAQKSNTSVAQLGEAVLVAGGQAKLAGMDTVELNTALGILADNGLKGSEGGTALRNALKNLYTPTAQAAKALDELNIKTVDSSGNLRDTQTVLQELGLAMDGMTEGDRITAMAKIFDTRTIAAGNALLKDSGARWDELSAQIANANGAAAAMAKTMNDNLKGDITILGSALEGLGVQIYSHFNKPLREATQAGTEAVGKLARELSRPDMKRALDALAGAFSSLITAAVNLATGAITALIKGFAGLVNSADVLIPVLAALLAAFVAYNAVLIVTSIVAALAAGFTLLEAAMLAMPIIMNAVTTAQTLLNAAMMLNPIGLVVAGVAALIGGLTALIFWQNRATDADKENKKQVDKLVAANEDLTASIEQSQQAYEDVNSDIQTQVGIAKSLTDRLFGLSEAEKETAVGQARMKMYMDELNQLMPELNIALDEQGKFINTVTGELYDNAAAIGTVIEAKKLQLEQQAAEERYNELIKEQIELEEQRALLELKIQEISESIPDGRGSRTRQIRDATAELNRELTINTQSIKDNADAQGVMSEKYSEIITKQQEEIQVLSDEQIALAEQKSQLNELADTWGVTSDAVTAAIEASGLSVEDFTTVMDDLTSAATDMFNKLSEESKVSVSEMAANLEHNQEILDRWADNIAILADRGINQGLLQTLRDAGPESAGAVAAIASASDEEFQRLNTAFENGGDAAVQAFITAFGKTEPAQAATTMIDNIKTTTDAAIGAATFEESGGKIDVDFGGGITDSTASTVAMTDKITDLRAHADTEIKNNCFEETGDQTVEDQATGITNSTAAEDAAKENVQRVYSAIESEVQGLGFWNIGLSMMEGLAEGIRNGSGLIEAAAREAARQAYESAKNELGVNSPSKRFRYLGQMSVEGYADAIREGRSAWESAISDSIQSTLATADAQRLSVARGQAAAIVTHNTETTSGGDIIIEKVVVEGVPINNVLDAEKIGRKIGEKAAKQIRLRGGLALG